MVGPAGRGPWGGGGGGASIYIYIYILSNIYIYILSNIYIYIYYLIYIYIYTKIHGIGPFWFADTCTWKRPSGLWIPFQLKLLVGHGINPCAPTNSGPHPRLAYLHLSPQATQRLARKGKSPSHPFFRFTLRRAAKKMYQKDLQPQDSCLRLAFLKPKKKGGAFAGRLFNDQGPGWTCETSDKRARHVGREVAPLAQVVKIKARAYGESRMIQTRNGCRLS